MAKRTPMFMLATYGATKKTSARPVIRKFEAQNFQKQMKVDVVHARKRPCKAQAQDKQHFHVRLCHTNELVLLGNMLFVEATSIDQQRKLSLAASGSFFVLAIDTHTVTIQRPDKIVNKISR